MSQTSYTPGSLLRARGREWIVLPGSIGDLLHVRPLSGSEEDHALIHIGLETEPVGDASFPPPDLRKRAGHDAALLLRDALILSLRRGAGPFRGFGQIAVEPRAYQLVPLLMALKQDPVRLLIADDVGIGKTIEASLIARELLDRGDISRTAVLCPPHLVDQWVTELEVRFHISAVAVSAASANRLERNLPPSESIFSAHPHTVVSLDYIKSERRRSEFLRACPDFVIVDEAHTCASTGQGRHQRYDLLKGLSASPMRHMVLLTATPHSGDEDAFYRLLGLLHPDFVRLEAATGDERNALRERLSQHFVQRRRPDIDEWHDGKIFPRRQTKELTYKLSGAWEQFFDRLLSYCSAVVHVAEGDVRWQRLNFWGTLALLRCAASSPSAAVAALRTRAGLAAGPDEEETLEDRVFDGSSDSLSEDDVEPPAGSDDPALRQLIEQAEKLTGLGGDPKLKLLTEHLTSLLAEGFSPVVFCRYIATAHYLARHLAGRFKDVTLSVITGELTAEARREKVAELVDTERKILIATDCLSEGINLQDAFDAVVHYDLSWNPTRHEQREGRVDRFGQTSPIVRATLMYGANNPVDGAVLEVILRKAEKIREELGVPVPLPDSGHVLTQALLRAVLLRQGKISQQQAFDFQQTKEAQAIDSCWQDAADKAQRNRTIFAQRRLKPADVLPEWKKALAAIGGKDDVQRFCQRALARLGSGLSPLRRGYKVALSGLPDDVRDRLETEGLSGMVSIDFSYPSAPGCRPVQRSHPIVSVLAETLLERSLGSDAEGSDPGVLGRIGTWIADGIQEKTTVVLLRLRHQLVCQRGEQTTTLLCEESSALAFVGSTEHTVEGAAALALLEPDPVGDPPLPVRDRVLALALELIDSERETLSAFAERRAQELLSDHRRVRTASDARGSYSVKPLLPADVIGVYVLLPKVN